MDRNAKQKETRPSKPPTVNAYLLFFLDEDELQDAQGKLPAVFLSFVKRELNK